jgi:hypothetical protein
MRRDVRAIFVDDEQRTTRRQSAPMRHGKIVQRDDQHDQRGDEREAAGACAFHGASGSLKVSKSQSLKGEAERGSGQL